VIAVVERPWRIQRPAPNGNTSTPRRRLPFVQEYFDRNGKLRRYLRRRGCLLIPLPGKIGSAEFMAAYRSSRGT
jgi:hypothetical protein